MLITSIPIFIIALLSSLVCTPKRNYRNVESSEIDKTIEGFCSSPTFESFPYPPHPILTSFHIRDTIHYKALIKNKYEDYEYYIKTTSQKEHSLKSFLNLWDNFDLNKMDKIKVVYNFEKNRYFIKDGVHRLSILLYKKLIINNCIPIKYMDIENNSCFYQCSRNWNN